MDAELRGRTALVTGASRGIGAAVARGLATQGAAVVVHHAPEPRMRELAEGVVDDIRSAGPDAKAVGADLADPAQIDDLFALAGDVDILVANAAASDRRNWTDLGIQEWDTVLAVNLRAAFLCARAVHKHMAAVGWGRIITLGSVMNRLGMNGSLHYVTTKAGLEGFTRSLAREVGADGITVNCVAPGAIRTEHEIERHPDGPATEHLNADLVSRQCVPRRGTADDLVSTFQYLASPRSGFITGQVIIVDGGWTHT